MSRFLTPAWTVLAFFLLSLLVWVFLFIGKLPSITDVFLHTLPSRYANLALSAQGWIPLWDPAIGCGTPQLASGLGAFFYPPYWLWNLTGFSHGLVWMSFLHLVFAYAGFFLWARTQGIAPTWAALGALSFAGSLHMTRLWGYPVFLATQAWTPWVFFLAAKALREGRAGAWAVFGGAVSLQLLAGYPHFTFYSLAFVTLWVLLNSQGPRPKIGCLLALAGAFALTAVHWLPFLDFLGHAQRGDWGPMERYPYFLRWGDLATLFSPTALGSPEMEGYRGHMANANFNLYFGLLPLAAWVASFVLRSPGRVFWSLASLGWLAWMMGERFPLWHVLPEDGLRSMDPTKAVGVFLLAACTCAGSALTRAFRQDGVWSKRNWVVWVLGGVWCLDVLSVAPRVTHPVPDPFLKSKAVTLAEKLGKGTGGGRILALRTREQGFIRGDGKGLSSFEAAADSWVQGFLANSQALWGIRSPQAYLSLWVEGMGVLWGSFNRLETYEGALPDIVGVRSLLLPVELKGPRYRTIAKGEGQWLLENLTALPDAWPADREERLPDLAWVLRRMEQARGGELKGKVLFEGTDVLPPPKRGLAPGFGSAAGWHRVSPARAFYKGELAGSKWLFWNETFAPGWRAWVDGKPSPIHRAGGFFMAVPLPQGGGTVEFRYEPTAFRLGFFLSLCFALLGSILVFRVLWPLQARAAAVREGSPIP